MKWQELSLHPDPGLSSSFCWLAALLDADVHVQPAVRYYHLSQAVHVCQLKIERRMNASCRLELL
jgi:hypothetical protein